MTRFHARLTSLDDLAEIEGSWVAADFERLLEAMDYGNTAGLGAEELREMCILSLQDREPAAAAALVLEHRLGDELTKGQIQNVARDLLDEKLWEDYADMPLHERLFHVGSLLHAAFPADFPQPDAVDVRLELSADDEEGVRVLAGPLPEAFLVRMLAAGMPESAKLRRLFGESLGTGPFPEAESILWMVTTEPGAARSVGIRAIGSGCWLDALRNAEAWEYVQRPD